MTYHDVASNASATKIAALKADGKRLPLKTGLCLAGWHEGSKPRTRDGRPIKTCPMFDSCPCQCHRDLDEIFELSGKPRELVENLDYVPVRSSVVAYEVIEAPGMFDSETVVPEGALITVAPGLVPAHKERIFPPTPSGRLARGQADYLTLSATDAWVVESQFSERMEQCTAQWVHDFVLKETALELDVTTVIAVWKRWIEIGIARVEQNPIRFVGYTPEAIERGFEPMVDAWKRFNSANSK